MSYIYHTSLVIENQQNINRENFLAFLQFLIDERYTRLDKDVALEYSNDETGEEKQAKVQSIEEIVEFVERHDLDNTQFTLAHSNEYGLIASKRKNLCSELVEQVQDGAYEAAEQSDEYSAPSYEYYATVGFGNAVDPVSGSRNGWHFYIGSDGYFGDLELFERSIMEESPHFRIIRENMERIFKSKIRFDYFIMG